MKKIRNGKSTGHDGISSEIIKEMDEIGIENIHQICQRIWDTTQWPEDWTLSTLIPIHKKGSKTKHDNYRLIALIPHASKIMLHIINERLKTYLSWQIPEEQTGFVKGKGTREQILNVRQLIEKAREYNVPLYLCFIDYKKAFDSIKWDKLWTILAEMGVPKHIIILIKNLYQNSKAVVKIDNHLSKPCDIKKGVRQGCILSPLLFNIYGEYVMRITMDNWEGGFTIGGTKISNLRYADDTTLLASTETELIEIIEKLEDISQQYGLEINHNKTNIMIVDRKNRNRPDLRFIRDYKVVNNFVFLGSTISNEGGCELEIRRRIQIARNAMTKLQKVWKDRQITMNTKKAIVEALIFPIMTYGSETWTIKMADRRRIDAFEMWVWRRLLRIPWTAHRTNVSVLEEINSRNRLSSRINANIVKYFGHINRRNSSNLERLIIQGKVEGARTRGRSPKRWSDQIKTLTGKSLHEATRTADNRERRREVAQRIRNE